MASILPLFKYTGAPLNAFNDLLHRLLACFMVLVHAEFVTAKSTSCTFYKQLLGSSYIYSRHTEFLAFHMPI